jgi:signal transduction histidine kinase
MKPIYYRIIIFTLVFILASVFSGFIVYKSYTDFNAQLLQRTALLLGNSVEEALLKVSDRNLEELTTSEKTRLRQLMRSMTTDTGSILHILLINKNMKILLSSDPNIEGHEYKTPIEIAKLQGNEPKVLRKTWEDNVRIVDVIIPLLNEDETGYGYLRLVLSYQELSTFFTDITRVFIPLIIMFSFLLLFSFYLLSRTYTKPIESFKKVAKQLSKGNFEKQIKYSRKDEFTDTFTQINKSIEEVNILKESYKNFQKRIAALLQVVDESIILLDSEENISSFNVAAANLLECPLNMDFSEYFNKVKLENRQLREHIKSALMGEEIDSAVEMTIWLPNEGNLLIRLSTQVFREGERVSGVLLDFKDIYLLNELEHNLLRSMKFGVIANLASSISHEIRNPLSSLAMHTEVLFGRLKKFAIKDNDPAYKSLNVLQNELSRIHRIISQFLNLARSRETTLTQLRINALIQDVLTLVQQQAIERNITIETILDDSVDFIYGDADQIKQVILNVVLNAFQAIEKDGTVSIKSYQSNTRIRVEIQDTGKGMSQEVSEHVFDLYYTTKKDSGGIGLAVSKNIMQAHEGFISFESMINKGTTFFLDFPQKDSTKSITPIPKPRRIR